MLRTYKDKEIDSKIQIVANNFGEIEVKITSQNDNIIESKKVFPNLIEFEEFWKERPEIIKIGASLMNKQQENNPNWVGYNPHN
jgi:hypothetical protein